MSAQNQDLDSRPALLELLGHLDTFYIRQLHIQQQNIRAQFLDQTQCLPTVRSLANYRNIHSALKQVANTAADYWMIVS